MPEETMREIWLPLCLITAALVLFQAVSLVRDRIAGIAPKYPAEWSVRQYCYLKDLRTLAGMGLVIVWIALIYVGPQMTQLWRGGGRAGPHMTFTLLYTMFWLILARQRDWTQFGNVLPARVFGHLVGQTVLISTMFFATIIAIAD
jgi:hypothetical protein